MSGIFGAFDSGSGRASTSDFTVWADARLDYRADLARSLGLATGELPKDADLILAAYEKWGEACVEHLFGDFAFAIRDPQRNSLFCARDHFGMRPFYYHHSPGERFVFASDARDMFCVPEVPYVINEGRIADFIVPELEWIDYTSTFYEGVHRLPPGHALTVRLDDLSGGAREYWRPEPGPEIGPMSDEDWVEGFVDVFANAVRERLRGGSVGVMLSGGLDSGSVAAVANELLSNRGDGPLRTISLARPDPGCVESNRIRATTGFLGASARLVDPGAAGGIDDELVASIEEPYDAESLFMKALYLDARDAGMQALLDGGAGDVVLSPGTHIARLIRRGRLVEACRETVAESRHWKANAFSLTAGYLATALGPASVKNAARPLKERWMAKRFVARSLISTEFARRVDIAARCRRMFGLFPTAWTGDYALERVRKIRPNVTAGRERYARLAKFGGIEARDPFLDRRVVDFCSRIPGHLLQHDGWLKVILREAMAGRLPDDVCRGHGKPHIGWIFSENFLKREKNRGRLSLDALRAATADLIDADKLGKAWQQFESGGNHGPLHTAYVASLWLAQNGHRPIVQPHGFS